jgi:hypothetical protein
LPEDFIQQMTAFSRQVGAEDNALTTSVPIGSRSGLPDRGRLLGKSEQLATTLARAKLQVAHSRLAALVGLPVHFQSHIQAGEPTVSVDPGVDTNCAIENERAA